jgi:hypothetical protein
MPESSVKERPYLQGTRPSSNYKYVLTSDFSEVSNHCHYRSCDRMPSATYGGKGWLMEAEDWICPEYELCQVGEERNDKWSRLPLSVCNLLTCGSRGGGNILGR